MKKFEARRVLAVLLALALVISLAACAGSAPEESSTPEPSTESSVDAPESTPEEEPEEEEPEYDPLAPMEEAVTISWSVPASSVQQFFDGDTFEDNRWSRLIKEELNIDLEVAFSADKTTDAYNNKMNVLLATGEFPDIVRYSNRLFFAQAVEAGYLAPIGDALEQYGSPEVKEYQTLYPESFEGAKINGELYAFPSMNDNFHQAAFLWIRDDWLENTGTTPPTTIEEMVELARIFTEEDPDGDGVDDTYGFGLAGSVVQSNYGTLLGLAGAYGVPGYGNNGIFYRDDNGEMTFSYLNPAMKEVLSLVHDMYEAGYINPEFTAEDVSSMEADITDGTLGMMYHMNWGTWHPFNYSYQQEGVLTRPYPIPTAEGYEPKMGISSAKTGDLYMVGANCESLEAVIKILNLFEAKCCSSEDPNDFTYYWANEQAALCPIMVTIPTELYAPEIHEALEAGSGDALVGTAADYYNLVVGFEDGSITDNSSAYGTWGQMFLSGQGGSMKIALDYKDKGWLVTNAMEDKMPDIWIQNSSVLGDMVDTTFVDIIVGNQPVDYFDTFVENWLAAGGQETLDWLEENYPAE